MNDEVIKDILQLLREQGAHFQSEAQANEGLDYAKFCADKMLELSDRALSLAKDLKRLSLLRLLETAECNGSKETVVYAKKELENG